MSSPLSRTPGGQAPALWDEEVDKEDRNNRDFSHQTKKHEGTQHGVSWFP